MRSVLLRELSIFSPESLSRKLSFDLETTKSCIESLSACGVLKIKSLSEHDEYDASYGHESSGCYQFSYVGLAMYADIVLVIYPKYLLESQITNDKIQQIFRVLRKSAGGFSEIATSSEDGVLSNGKLGLMLNLLEMYDEYGVYTNYVKVLNRNGNGDISWGRTIAKNTPYINDDNTPIYFDFETVETARDVSDYVTRLHKCVLTQCSHFMRDCGLSELLSLDDIELSSENLEDFGDIALTNYRLEREHGTQFITWKQNVIDLIRRFVNDSDAVVKADDVVTLGTTSFYNVWEKACKAAVHDCINRPIGSLGFQLVPTWASRAQETLLDLIPRPLWHRETTEGESDCGDVATLIPDAISLWETSEGKKVFGIFDAKYYVPVLGRITVGTPGVDSITKQFLYQSAYKQFIQDHGFNRVVNSFLIPVDSPAIQRQGRVEFPGVFAPVQKPFSNDIALFALPAQQIWQCYLSDVELPADKLAELFV